MFVFLDKVPLFPLFHGLGILFTSYLLMSMNHSAWYRLGIWSAVGKLGTIGSELLDFNFCFQRSCDLLGQLVHTDADFELAPQH
jgi:hypothetical protein